MSFEIVHSVIPADAVEVFVENRSTEFDKIYVIPTHKLAPDYGEYQGKIFMLIADTRDGRMAEFQEWLDKLQIPEGTDEGVKAAGADYTYFSVIPLLTMIRFFGFGPRRKSYHTGWAGIW